MIKLALVSLLTVASVPVAAANYQEVMDFDSLPIGTGGFSFDPFGDSLFRTIVFGGVVSAATISDPAVSGAQVYRGLSIGFRFADPVDPSWPAVGLFFTSNAPITVTLSEYDYDLSSEVEVFTTTLSAGLTNFYFSVGDAFNPRSFTSALFESQEPFSIDNLTLGLPSVAPGIPEPASWAMMVGGLCLVGASMRRRKVAVSFASKSCLQN